MKAQFSTLSSLLVWSMTLRVNRLESVGPQFVPEALSMDTTILSCRERIRLRQETGCLSSILLTTNHPSQSEEPEPTMQWCPRSQVDVDVLCVTEAQGQKEIMRSWLRTHSYGQRHRLDLLKIVVD